MSMADAIDLKGKTVIVTGAGSGIGQALARGFASDGANVVACDINEDGLAETVKGHNGSFHTCRCDVAEASDVTATVDAALEQFGTIDIVINNAGITFWQPFHEVNFDHWSRVIDVNLTGLARVTHQVLPHMIKAGQGRIVNVISRGAESSAPGTSQYGASKSGAMLLTRAVANEMKALDADILSNALIPGMTNSSIWDRDMPQMQPCEAVYPHAKFVATLPADGPNGLCFWNSHPYPIFGRFSDGVEWDTDWEEAGNAGMPKR